MRNVAIWAFEEGEKEELWGLFGLFDDGFGFKGAFGRILGSWTAFRLDLVGVDDGFDEAGEAGFYLGAAGGVVHLNATALSADEAGFAEGFEVLGEGGLGDRPLADVEKIRTILGALGAGNIHVDGDADRIRESVEDAFDGDVLNRRVKKRPHNLANVWRA